MLISLDTETTGVDFRHGARPFFVTTCDEHEQHRFWEWDVDPLTRVPLIPEDDVDDLGEFLSPNETSEIVFQNAKFDVTALSFVRPEFGEFWRWECTQDTLIAGHLLASNQPHDLTSMVLHYLGYDIEKYELALKKACVEARRYAKKHFPNWQLAASGRGDMPSARGSVWKYDCWLPRAIAVAEKRPATDPWYTVLREYSNVDSAVTLALWREMERHLENRSLLKIYRHRMCLLPAIYRMERAGVSIDQGRTGKLQEQYAASSARHKQNCLDLSEGKVTQLPINGRNKALDGFLFEELKLPVVKVTKLGNPSADKYAIDEWMIRLPESSREFRFLDSLKSYRKRQTALGYIESYQGFWVDGKRCKILYPSANPTATVTLRFSMNNPNGQQISKQGIFEQGENRSARYMFGPAPGREWWAMDYENIELRLPAYEAGEELMIQLFERPDEPPYYGSQHLLFFDILHPDLYARHGRKVKEIYADTWYQWTKNGDFAVQYGAVAESGTADRAYHVPGAQLKIEDRLRHIKQLSQRMIAFADKHGYVETIPDRTVDPDRGYPLMCTRTQWSKVKPTEPLSYRIQGTAMQCTCKAMVRCDRQLTQWTEEDPRGYYMILQVHDELVFDFPYKANMGNRPCARKLQRLMEQSGQDIGIPLKVSVKYHVNNWAEGVSL